MGAQQRALVIEASHPELGRVFAAIDASARFTRPELRPSRLGALLTPFPDEPSARHALAQAGAKIEG